MFHSFSPQFRAFLKIWICCSREFVAHTRARDCESWLCDDVQHCTLPPYSTPSSAAVIRRVPSTATLAFDTSGVDGPCCNIYRFVRHISHLPAAHTATKSNEWVLSHLQREQTAAWNIQTISVCNWFKRMRWTVVDSKGNKPSTVWLCDHTRLSHHSHRHGTSRLISRVWFRVRFTVIDHDNCIIILNESLIRRIQITFSWMLETTRIISTPAL